jgi:hypothetical protein
MTLVETLELLSKARWYVLEGEREVSRQRVLVEWLEERGDDPIEAIIFLEQLEDMQNQYVAHRDQLEKKVMGLVRPED